MLKISNITKTFGGITALSKCSFEVPKEQITALIGPNGAGKTTLMDTINGLYKPDKGVIELEGKKISNLRPDQIARLGVARTFQQVRIFKYVSITDHLNLTTSHSDQYLWNVFKKSGTTKKEMHDYLCSFGVDKDPDIIVEDLSYGQRKLLQIAMALKFPHKLLLLDEPVAGVNTKVQEQIEQLLLKLKKQGETILIIEHDMEFIRTLADKVVCMDAGAVLAEGSPEQVLSNPRVVEAYLGS